MKKILIIITLAVCINASLVSVSLAQNTTSLTGSNPVANTTSITGSNPSTGCNSASNSSGVATLCNPLKVESLGDLVKSGVQVFSYIAILIAVIMFVVVGLKYIFAMGNPEKMKAASNWLLYIVIGVAVVIGANLAVTIVINTLSATGAVDPKVIQSAKDALPK